MENLASISPEDIVKLAEETAIQISADGLKTHQIRNIFSSVNKVRTSFKYNGDSYESAKRDFILLKPKIAFAAGKQEAFRKNFYGFLLDAINAVENAPKEDQKQAMKNFFVLVESVVAYQRFHGDKGRGRKR